MIKSLSGLFVAALMLLAGCGKLPSNSPEPLRGKLEVILSTTQPEQTDFSYIKKIDSNLQNLVADYLSGKDIKQIAQASGLQVSDNKEVLLDIYVTNSVTEAVAQLTSLGMTVQATNESDGVVEGLLPIDRVLAAARLDFIKALLPVMASGTDKMP